ncbi:ChrR family anti-sigma-E factor [Breoghania sp. L-A4]|uniref:ChrR family anti-sigma-E factor n=1 Tax=Breoghania sp. L-A4 TaxID=2304600 RepID=UPI000E35EFCA|nr:ChrR family anti-sigma-E factor [Breoghania sp. L-A4]AXS41506.1 transcriptional regulator [Breoghania sp. L-A4]
MTILHHLDHTTLLRHASGDLDEPFAAIVAAHLAMCEDCRRGLRIAEDLGGSLLEDGETVSLADDALARIMRCIDEGDGAGEPIRAEQSAAPEGRARDVPVPLRRYIGPSLADIPWKTVAPGVRRHKIALTTPTRSAFYMLKIEPGKAVPEHGHGGAEITLILSGAYRDELGRFGPGDVADLDEHVEHQPKVDPGEPCICIVATEAPTRFKGLFSRLLQPLVGI